MKMTLNLLMMVLTIIMKAMNTTLKMVVDAVEMINDMTGLIKTAKNKTGLIKMLVIVLMMKVFDVMISNTVNALTDMVRMITKLLNATDMIQIIECIIAMAFTLIIAIVDLMKNKSVEINNNISGTVSEIFIFRKITTERIKMNRIKTTDSCEARLHSSIKFPRVFQTDPLCQVKYRAHLSGIFL